MSFAAARHIPWALNTQKNAAPNPFWCKI